MDDTAAAGAATPDALAEAGVEVGVVSPVEPPRAAFTQVDDLPEKSKSDVRIRLADGTEFRERILRVAQTTSERDGGAPLGFNVVISNALLDGDGEVVVDGDGKLRITPPEVCHEFNISAEDMGAMTEEQIGAALTHAREVAAARHRAYFEGMDKGAVVFGNRLSP